TMRGRALQHLEMQTELRGALDRGELAVHYQPIIDIQDRMVVGVEALVRWEHPVRGFIAPIEWVGIAEESDLIASIGGYVLQAASHTIGTWNLRKPRPP